MSTLVMYSLRDCPTCIKARDALTRRGVAFEERPVDDRPDWQEQVLKISKQNTVPVFVAPDDCVEIGFEGEHG